MERASGVTKIIFKHFIQPPLCQLNKCFTELLSRLTFLLNKKRYSKLDVYIFIRGINPVDHFKKVKLEVTEKRKSQIQV